MSKVAVSVEHVSKKFRLYHEKNQNLKTAIMRGKRTIHEDFWALRDVSFDVPEGSTFGLIGSNGSGKSTLLKCLAKIYYPTEGTIKANGKVAALLEVGSGFHPELSGRENIYLNGSILGMSKKKIDSKFDQIVEFSGVEEFIDQPVKNYSSGMYVRLGFSVAIHVEPEILIVDEVLAVGDASFQAKCRQKFIDFKQEGRTVILVSHSMGMVKEMCDQVAWLNKGKFVESGSAAKVIKAYENSVQQ
jgi:ABC-2 type transport system ATP-binding protein